MKFRKINEERTWSFGPSGRSTDNWMGGDSHQRGDSRPRHSYQNKGGSGKRNGGTSEESLRREEFKDKFPSIPDVSELDNGFSASVHQRAERIGRDEAIDAYAGGHGERIIAVYYADRLNPNGAEYHWITNNGIIIITNAEKDNGRQIVTKLIARPVQLKRYPNNQLYGDSKYGHGQEQVDAIQVYPSGSNWRVPKQVLDLAQLHQDLGLNYMEESALRKNVDGIQYAYGMDLDDRQEIAWEEALDELSFWTATDEDEEIAKKLKANPSKMAELKEKVYDEIAIRFPNEEDDDDDFSKSRELALEIIRANC